MCARVGDEKREEDDEKEEHQFSVMFVQFQNEPPSSSKTTAVAVVGVDGDCALDDAALVFFDFFFDGVDVDDVGALVVVTGCRAIAGAFIVYTQNKKKVRERY